LTADERSLDGAAPPRTLILHPVVKSRKPRGRAPDARLKEAVGLGAAIRLDVVEARLIPLRAARAGTLFGRGAVDEIAETVRAEHLDLVIVDAALAPIQQRNLERAWLCKVIDRTGLILEIFGARARTREGRLQVELASLTYQRGRLVRSWTHLERQRGGTGFLGGPGESQLESDRRQIGARIMRLRGLLAEVARTRELQRKARRRVPYPIVALVGYTNAGKSTLFNRLTGATVAAADKLFATLDPTMRRLVLPSGRKVILSDTVGFISDLPTDLVAAFRATLEEVIAADIIVHVRDISAADSAAEKQDVEAVLRDLDIDATDTARVIEVHNKIDLLGNGDRPVSASGSTVVALSALTGAGCDTLCRALDARLAADRQLLTLRLKLSDGAALAWLYRHGEVLSRTDDDEYAHLRVGLDDADSARFQSRFPSAETAPAD
jgi:GTP-binding protein HflX